VDNKLDILSGLFICITYLFIYLLIQKFMLIHWTQEKLQMSSLCSISGIYDMYRNM